MNLPVPCWFGVRFLRRKGVIKCTYRDNLVESKQVDRAETDLTDTSSGNRKVGPSKNNGIVRHRLADWISHITSAAI